MCRNLLYTAVTRAKKIVVLVGNAEAAARMVLNDKESVRYTGLEEKLKNTLKKDTLLEEM